jgi:hypothetical protein
MSYTEAPKKVGGEVGEVRANIDVDALNKYLTAAVPAVKAPVKVKQFKVRYVTIFCKNNTYRRILAVWAGRALHFIHFVAEIKPGLSLTPHTSSPTLGMPS